MTKFEGSMIKGYNLNKNNLHVELIKDEVTEGYLKEYNYNHHFHFGIRNLFNKGKKLTVLVECDEQEKLKNPFKRIWVSENIDDQYKLINVDGEMKVPGKYKFTINLKPGKNIFIANYSPIRYSNLLKRIEFAAKRSHGIGRVIGKTVQDRDIVSYEYGDVEKNPVIMFIAGYHPPEMEPIAIESIMELLNEKEKRESIIDKYAIVLVPFVNPDGFANMKQGSNINDINFHWRFFGNTQYECPECYALWEYCKKIKPVFFMDFHIFTFQNNERRPYIIPPFLYSNKLFRDIIYNINNKLVKICNGNRSFSEKIISPNLLSSMLRTEIGTVVSPKFHLHIKDGTKECKDITKNIFLSIIDIYNNYDIMDIKNSRKKPYGYHEDTKIFIIKMKIINFYYFKIRPKIKL